VVVGALQHDVFYTYGFPDEIRTDGGSHIDNKRVSTFIASKVLKHTISTAYHPEGQGVTERANRTILKALRAAVGKRFADWGQQVPAVQWHLNTRLNTSVGCASFTAVFGREPPTELSTSMGKPHDLFRGVDHYMTLVREWQDYVNRVQQQAYLRATTPCTASSLLSRGTAYFFTRRG